MFTGLVVSLAPGRGTAVCAPEGETLSKKGT